MTETLLYGCKIGEPNYMEEILYQCKGYTNKEELLKKGAEWAAANGYEATIYHFPQPVSTFFRNLTH